MAYSIRVKGQRRRLLKVLVLGSVEFLVIVVIVLLVSASHIRSMAVGTGMDIGLGPVHLMHIEKSAASGGYSLAFSFYPTMGILLLLCLVLEAVLTWKFSSRPAQKSDEAETSGDS